MAPLLALQQSAVHQWLASQGIDADKVQHALSGLERAAVTADYLAKIPA